jgi:fumarate reductase subunit C
MDRAEGFVVATGFERRVATRLAAKLDLTQSLSGLALALFMWVHMLLVSSILLGKDVMWRVAKLFEGYWFFGRAYPWLVSLAAATVLVLFAVHALLAMRKAPSTWKQYSTFRTHMKGMRHDDTNLWFAQVYTGFAMLFLGSVHLYVMLTNPDRIGPYESADRVWSGWMWPLYILLLLAVEFHGAVGLYRLAVKWGWFEGKDPTASRRNLKRAKWALTIFFLVLGFTTLGAYIKIGIEHRGRVGERYVPAAFAPHRQP